MAHYQQPQQSLYGRCDTSFAESRDDGIWQSVEPMPDPTESRLQNLDYTAIQQAIAEDLSEVTAGEYQEDIMQHMIYMESQTLLDVDLIVIQQETRWHMRPYVLDFLLKAHAFFDLLPETLFLAVNLLDRYCSRRVVHKRHYQVVACAVLLIAAKYGDEKDQVPTSQELSSMSCQSYSNVNLAQMEWHVLQTLDWAIGHSTVHGFLQIALLDASNNAEVKHMALFIAEIALFHREFVATRPYVLARCTLALARCILPRTQAHNPDWLGTCDPQTVINLSKHLRQPPPALLHKYPSMPLSTVLHTLDEFLRRRAQITRLQAAQPALPPTSNAYGPHIKNNPILSTCNSSGYTLSFSESFNRHGQSS